MFLNQSVSMIKILSIQFFLPCPYLIDLFVLVELWPKDFNQDMCSWASKLSSSTNAGSMFVGTGCPTGADPNFSGWPSPLCYECSAPTASPTASVYPSSSPTFNPTDSPTVPPVFETSVWTMIYQEPVTLTPNQDTIEAALKSCVMILLESDENLRVGCDVTPECPVIFCTATLDGTEEEVTSFGQDVVMNNDSLGVCFLTELPGTWEYENPPSIPMFYPREKTS